MRKQKFSTLVLKTSFSWSISLGLSTQVCFAKFTIFRGRWFFWGNSRDRLFLFKNYHFKCLSSSWSSNPVSNGQLAERETFLNFKKTSYFSAVSRDLNAELFGNNLWCRIPPWIRWPPSLKWELPIFMGDLKSMTISRQLKITLSNGLLTI